jgi:hypothetical protein
MTVEKLVLDRLDGKKPEHEHQMLTCPECKVVYCIKCMTPYGIVATRTSDDNVGAYSCPLCGAWIRLDKGTNGRSTDPIYETEYRRM